MSTPPPPAGWYADPQAPSRWRWWDGAQWTQHVGDPAGTSAAALKSADYLVVRASARLARWNAAVHDRSLAPIGSVAQRGMQLSLLDAAGGLVLEADAGSTISWSRSTVLPDWTIRDAAGTQLGSIAVTKYFNRRLTVMLRGADGADVGRLEPIGKVDHDFSIADAAGTGVARVWRAERERELFNEDETWAAQIARPIPPPLDSLALIAVCTLDAIQHVVLNRHSSHRSRF